MVEAAGGIIQKLTFPLFFKTLLKIVSIIYFVFIIHYLITFWTDMSRAGTIFLGLSMILLIIYLLSKGEEVFFIRNKKANIIVSIMLLALSIYMTYYLIAEYYNLTFYRAGALNEYDLFIGLIAIILSIELTRKVIDPWVAGTAVVSLLAAYLFLGFSVKKLISSTSADIVTGIFGPLNQITLHYIAIFTILGALLDSLGGLEALFNIIRFLIRHLKINIPLATIIGSGTIGGPLGSSLANVAGAGVITIPMMKKYGLPASFAGAIESLTSVGAQISPPILGAAAFLMADILGTTYWNVVVWSILPFILYFLVHGYTTWVISRFHRTSVNQASGDVEGETKIEVSFKTALLDATPIITVIFFLFFLLGYMLLDAAIAGTITFFIFIPTTIMIRYIKQRKEVTVASFLKKLARDLVDSIENSATTTASLAVLIGCMGIIVAILEVSGLGLVFSREIIRMSGGNVALLIFLTAIAVLILGLGLPTTPSYLFAIIILQPAFIKLGLPLAPLHFFVLFYACYSPITPPVHSTVAVAAKIGGADVMDCVIKTMLMGIPLYILPVYFVTNPELLLWNEQTLFTFIKVSLYLLAFPIALFVKTKGLRGYIIRGLLLILGCLSLTVSNVGLISELVAVTILILGIFAFKLGLKTLVKPAS
jgi:TRAP transporter 4TM/12TM fusion protein